MFAFVVKIGAAGPVYFFEKRTDLVTLSDSLRNAE
jgi:hypothetical protein